MIDASIPILDYDMYESEARGFVLLPSYSTPNCPADALDIRKRYTVKDQDQRLSFHATSTHSSWVFSEVFFYERSVS